MTRYQPTLPSLLQSYFQEHLRRVRGASEHTVRSYRDGLRLFLVFSADKLGCSVADVGLDDVRADLVLAFLDTVRMKEGPNTAHERVPRGARCGAEAP